VPYNTALDNALGAFQGRTVPSFARAADSAPITDLVAAGSTTTSLVGQLGGFAAGALIGRMVRLGDETRKITANTGNTLTVASAFLATPAENQTFTVLGGEFVWTLGFDFRDRREHFAFGDGIQIENHIPLAGVAFLTAKVWIKQPSALVNQRTLTAGATIIPNSSSVVDDITPGLPAIDDFTATGSTSTAIQLTIGGLVLGALIGRTLRIANVDRTITANGTSDITVGLAFPSAPPTGVGLRVIERGPRITTHTAHHAAVGDMIAVNNVVWNGTPPTLNRVYPIRAVISSTIFELDAPAGGSGTYGGGANIGLRERFDFPAGLSEDDVGRYVLVSGATNTANNATYRIVGIRQQPSKAVPTQAWLQRTGASASLQGVVAGGSTTTVLQVASPTLVSSAHVGRTLLIQDINGRAQESVITANTTSTITVSPAFTAAPATGTNFLVKTALVYEAVSGGAAIVAKGARWQVSLLVKNGGGSFVTCARAVQSTKQSGFFRTDLRAYVKGITADRTFAIRLEMIEHNPTEVYAL
jgi:hypothetical protein